MDTAIMPLPPVSRHALPSVATAPSGSPATDASTLFRPGDNCWRVTTADRAAFLIDADAYFSTLETVLRSARRSITIVGWDFDGRIRLRPREDEAVSPPLGTLLRQLVEAHPGLEVRILVWSLSLLHTNSAVLPMVFGAEWQRHPRIRVALDSHHPFYAAHHQKIVCVDGRIAFIGGIDLTVNRWDTRRHRVPEPRRHAPDGDPCSPIHDLQMMVEGETAVTLCEVVGKRWRDAKGEAPDLPPCDEAEGARWPEQVTPDFRNLPVAISRTFPGVGGEEGIEEIGRLTIDAFATARRCLYIETQYLTAGTYGDVLEHSLRQPEGPEIVIVMCRRSRGVVEHFIMGVNRDRMIRRLRRADRRGRLRVCWPQVPAPDGAKEVVVHSKLIIVDDRLVKIGSSNLNNRSIGLDTECDATIAARTPDHAAAVVALRDRLIAEHLGVEEEQFSALVAEHGSVVAAIDACPEGARCLETFRAMRERGATTPLVGTGLLDPQRPFNGFARLREALFGPDRSRRRV